MCLFWDTLKLQCGSELLSNQNNAFSTLNIYNCIKANKVSQNHIGEIRTKILINPRMYTRSYEI